MKNNCIPLFEPGGRITGRASAAVTGKTAVAITGDVNADSGQVTVGPPADAGARVFGIAAWDTASGGDVTVIRGSGFIVPVTLDDTAGGADAGDEVFANADGTATTTDPTGDASGIAFGVAVADADAETDAFVALY